MPADRKTPTQILAEMRRADPALDLAYQAHNEYLDADSADAGPIEDYIAKAIRSATADLERRLAEAEAQRDEYKAAMEQAVTMANDNAAELVKLMEERDAV